MSGGLAAPRETKRRVFFAVWPPDEVGDALAGIALRAAADCGGRPMRRETLHLTLAFVGAIEARCLPSLEAAAGAVIARGFVLRLDRLAYWPRNGIVWFGNDRPPVELLELVGSLNSELAGRRFPVERRPFAVHVTLVRKARCDGRLGEAQPLTWPVGDFVLVESNLGPEGAHYSLLRRWPLIASP